MSRLNLKRLDANCHNIAITYCCLAHLEQMRILNLHSTFLTPVVKQYLRVLIAVLLRIKQLTWQWGEKARFAH